MRPRFAILSRPGRGDLVAVSVHAASWVTRSSPLPIICVGGSSMSRAIIASALIILTMSGFAVAQDRGTFTVGNATARRGQKVTGAIMVPAGVDAATSIPVAVVHGAKPGPVLALVSGAHGTEYASIIALEKLIAILNPAEVSGTVIIVPLVNIASFERKVPHVNPVDDKSMNRWYPGKMDGTQTDRAS